MIADRRLYLTADRRRVVEAGDPGRAFLFATPGTALTQAEVQRHGLREEGGRIVLPSEARAAPVSEPRPEPEPSGEPVETPEPTAPTETSIEGEGEGEPDATEILVLPDKRGGGWWEFPDGRKVRTADLPEDVRQALADRGD